MTRDLSRVKFYKYNPSKRSNGVFFSLLIFNKKKMIKIFFHMSNHSNLDVGL
jgi:hypothetical protein